MQKITFLVQGSAEEPYTVNFYRTSAEDLHATCTCPAGENGQYCKHRISILLGNEAGVCSDNIEEISKIKTWLPGSQIDNALAKLVSAEAEFELAKSRVSAAKKNLASAMRPPKSII